MLIVIVPLLSAGCSGRIFQVAPRPVSPAADLTATATTEGLAVSAYAFTEDDRAFEQFGANLPLAGLLAVDLSLTNRLSESLRASRLRFELRDESGRKFKHLKPKDALKRLMKYYDIGFYALEARRRTRADMETLALALDSPLSAGEERRGLLYFETKRDVAGLSGLTLTIKSRDDSLASPVTVRLN